MTDSFKLPSCLIIQHLHKKDSMYWIQRKGPFLHGAISLGLGEVTVENCNMSMGGNNISIEFQAIFM